VSVNHIETISDTKVGLEIREILLLNKRTGLPVLSRVYGESSGVDPVLIAGLLSAIIQFAESIGGSFSLNDIGIKHGKRIFVRSQNQLACLLIVDRMKFDDISSENFLRIIETITSRVFESLLMMFASPYLEPLTPIETYLGISYEGHINQIISKIDETHIASFPEFGFIIDNIILESTMMAELEEIESEEQIVGMIDSMEESDSTYLGSTYSGVSKEIKDASKRKIKDIFAQLAERADEE
jgi:hypothetical protein